MGKFTSGGNYKNIKGYRCGALEAVEPVGKDKNGHYIWKCVCHKCGRTKEVNYTSLMAGKLKDCGCTPARGHDLTGMEKGALTVIEPAGLDKYRHRQWIVRCSMCRKKSVMSARRLLRDNPRCPICGA